MAEDEWEALSSTQQDLVARRARAKPYPADACPICEAVKGTTATCAQHGTEGWR